ncbi:hypothetical protein TNCV_1917291 [Trichonephila clavipes]|uniref:Uncharacterized protein n=1 Tax=Trichonephila clavipes TaxID=2585209 RepID=A0A8X6W0V4_TRICX|nr:hypothetical protein TNCV_1917291 [Trichonephila clavipes]
MTVSLGVGAPIRVQTIKTGPIVICTGHLTAGEVIKLIVNRRMGIHNNRRRHNVAENNFVIVWNIIRVKRPYGVGEFIKKKLEDVPKVLDPNNAALHKLFHKFPSRDTEPKDA